jgi:hypothetical protein
MIIEISKEMLMEMISLLLPRQIAIITRQAFLLMVLGWMYGLQVSVYTPLNQVIPTEVFRALHSVVL